MSNKKKYLPVIVIGAVAAVGYTGAAVVAKQKVRDVVDRHLARLEERLEQQGAEATVVYEDVSVRGFSLRPSAVVHGLQVRVSHDPEQGEVIITTPEVHFYPHNFGMTTYHLSVPKEIEVSQFFNDRPREQSLISYNGVPELEVTEQAGNEHGYQLRFPQSIAITTLTETERPNAEEGADHDEELPPIDPETAITDRVEIGYAANPEITWHTNKFGHPVRQKLLIEQLVVTYQYESYLAADRVSFDLSQKPANDDLTLSLTADDGTGDVNVATLFKVENLNFAALPVVNPVNVVNDVTYTGPAWLNEETAGKAGSVFTWEIGDVSVVTGLASFFASGKVVSQPEKEKLPHGQLTLRFDHLDKLFDYLSSNRPKAKEGLKKIAGGIERVSGADIAAGDVVSIELAREAGGRLKIGKLTLEEALAVAFETAIHLPGVLSAPVTENAVGEPKGAGDAGGSDSPLSAEGELVTPLDGVHAEEDLIEGDESQINLPPEVFQPPAVEAEPVPAPPVPADEAPVQDERHDTHHDDHDHAHGEDTHAH